MIKSTMTLTATLLVLGAMALTASAQTQTLGAAGLNSQIKNATPWIHQVSCRGVTGGHGCGAGWVWNGNRCVRC